LVELVDIYPTLCSYANIPVPNYVEGYSFKPIVNKPTKKWKTAAFSQFPTPALREWGAYPLRPAMKETFFGPLIKNVEARIIHQQKDKWNRNVFENTLMGYAMRTKDYRFIVWKDKHKPKNEPIFIELYNHKLDPSETVNIASKNPKLEKKLMLQFTKGWQGNKPKLK